MFTCFVELEKACPPRSGVQGTGAAAMSYLILVKPKVKTESVWPLPWLPLVTTQVLFGFFKVQSGKRISDWETSELMLFCCLLWTMTSSMCWGGAELQCAAGFK